MIKTLALVSAIFPLLAYPIVAGDTYTVSAEVQSTLGNLLRLADIRIESLDQKTDFPTKIGRVANASDEFSATLDKLASQIDEALANQMKSVEGQNIEAKLVNIALDKQKHPDLYGEIKRIYVTGVWDPMARAPRPPHLRPEHIAKEYRLVWEYFVLLPPPQSVTEHYDFRVREALQEIKSTASLVTLVHRYRITCRDGVPLPAVKDLQGILLGTMNAFCSEQALQAMLDCLSLSKEQSRRTGTSWGAEKYAYELLADTRQLGTGAKWRKVIEAFQKNNLPPDQRVLLEKVVEKK